MAAPAERSAEAAPSPLAGRGSIAAEPSAGGASTTGPDDALPMAGHCWRGKYQISDHREVGGMSVWRGTCVEGGVAVVLRAVKAVEPDVRAHVWAKLGGIDSPHLQHAREAQRAGEWRVEIADVPAGIPLGEWRTRRGAMDADTLKSIVAQIAEALGALHAFELVHLNLSPAAVFVAEEGPSLHCTVGALEMVTSFDRKEPVPATVDPFYAPPEAHGLHMHVAGPGLCAWDWWSLGRIAQELVLGRHVVAHLANSSDVSALRPRAEQLLVEADAKGPRAGAVEQMPALEPNVQLLLRGLLTSTREARWTGDNVDRWVRGLPVKEHYETRRTETHFRWRGRPCTVPEFAEVLQSAEHWGENSVQLFEPTTPGTLAHFLRWSASQGSTHEQLTSALELADSLPLKLSSATAQREAVTMVALLQLSGGKLVWRGRAFESATIAAMLQELGETDAVMILRALTTRSTALQIERIDPAAGRLLTELGRTVGDVENALRRHAWLASTDIAGSARLFRLALDGIPALRAMREGLGEKYAGSDHPAAEKLFKAQNVGRGELVALAWLSAAPEKFKFFTHAEAARRRAEALRKRGVELTHALTWTQLQAALNSGRIALAGWGWFILAWSLIALAAQVVWPGWRGAMAGVAPAGLALALRFVAAPRAQRTLREHLPDARWSWRDGPARCRRELRLAAGNATAVALGDELENTRKELAALANVQPPPAPLPELPRFRATRFIGTLSWVLLVGCCAGLGWRAYVHPPSTRALKAAWAPPAPAKAPAPEPKSAASSAAANAGEKEGDVKVTWPFKSEDNPVKVTVRSAEAANSAQVAYATKHGREMVAPYRPDTIGTLIVMPVPSADDVGVMIFDGKRGELVNQQVYLLDFRPIPRTFVELGGRKGVFLDR